ncbi:MAG: DUF4290 domain-containing protein [Crocinitomicaceae bacterium]|nr:DUF4290 domain-containing protein [Crocinitomicaceae bacterium]MDG1776369.1 DUF4290 domain-containing protein [Crocinitomicaceae bacterium]
MEYNTARSKMLLPEYGRNVQNMITHAMQIEDREERNRATRAIIEVMGQLNPHLRDVDDYRHKLWTHLFIMSDFKLDVDSPYEIPERESLEERPAAMEYPKSKIRYGHFGQYTEKILRDSKNVTDKKETEYLSSVMGNFMKKQFLKHNNTAVENTVIAAKMGELSDGKLSLENPDEDLTSTNQLLKTLGLQNNQNNNNRKSNNNNHKKQFKKKQYKK